MASENQDHVDIIIALDMAKEGFDWIWSEHTLTVDYRPSLIAEPAATEEAVTAAVNDT